MTLRPLHIALCSPFLQTKGGISSVVRDLSNAMSMLGHRVLTLAPDSGPVEWCDGRNRHLSAKSLSARDMINTLIERKDLDIVHVHGWATFLSRLALIREHRFLKRSVFTFHTQPHEAYLVQVGRVNRGLLRNVRVMFRNKVLSRCGAITTVSQSLAMNLGRYEGLRLNSVEVVPNGSYWREPDPWAVREFVTEQHLEGCYPIIVTIGVMAWDWKVAGIRNLLDGFIELRRRHPKSVLVIVGDGPLRPELECACRDLGCSSSVRFAGLLEEPSIALRAAHIYAHLASNEAYPVAVVEAMAAGMPVVGSNRGGVADAIQDGTTGLLVDSNPPNIANALELVAQDRCLAAALGTAARQHSAVVHDWSRIAMRYSAIYRRVINAV